MTSFQLINGDCLEVLKTLPDNSVDSIVTDPPYGISFMGKKWDYDVPTEEVWKECLRVLKPGGHLLAFAGTRTQHRMAVRIEDAGFEIRDMIAWIYASGFPKSLNIGKAVDKSDKGSAKLDFVRWMQTTGIRAKDIDDRLKTKGLISQTSNFAVHFFNEGQPALPTKEYWEVIQAICDELKITPPNEIEEYIDLRVYGSKQFRQREVVGKKDGNLLAVAPGQDNNRSATTLDITAPATEAAKQWEGWGTALKPALEPITVARKPLIGTVAENVLTHGTGGLNIDGCRVGTEEITTQGGDKFKGDGIYNKYATCKETTHTGRWPANLIHDGSDEVVELFPNESQRFFYTPKASKSERNRGCDGLEEKRGGTERMNNSDGRKEELGERDRLILTKNNHPTVKPVALMEYLVKLVSREGATVLDPFMGSGSTGIACKNLKREFIGIERDEEYMKIAEARIKAVPDTLL